MLPALSVAVALTLSARAAPSVVCVAEPPPIPQLATPERLSQQANDTVGAVLYQPFVPSGAAGETACVMVGPVVSIR